MSRSIDMTDVPAVSADDIKAAIDELIQAGRGLAIVNGVDEETISAVEARLWAKYRYDADRRVALSARLRSFLDVFRSRRLKNLFFEMGLSVLVPAAEIAANQRLNRTWGFNPQKFLLALQGELSAARARTVFKSDFDTSQLQHAA